MMQKEFQNDSLIRAAYDLFDKIFVLEDGIWILKRRRACTILEN